MPKRRKTEHLLSKQTTEIEATDDILGSHEAIHNAYHSDELTVELTCETQLSAIQGLFSNPLCQVRKLILIRDYQLQQLFTIENNTLTTIELYNCVVSNPFLESLFKFTKALLSLTLNQCKIASSCSIIHPIVYLTMNRLASLSLYHTTISQQALNQIFMNLHSKSSLHKLDIQHEQMIDTYELEEHISESQLTDLAVSPINSVSTLLGALTKRTRLQSLDLSKNHTTLKLTPQSSILKRLARSQLTKLVLDQTCDPGTLRIAFELITVKQNLSTKSPSEYDDVDRHNAGIILKLSAYSESTAEPDADFIPPKCSKRLF
jgi:hypothetical protein